jgi:cell shape-determining protein MreC
MKRTSRKSSLPLIAVVAVVLCALLVLLVARSTLAGVLWRIAAPISLHNPFAPLVAQFHSTATLMSENTLLKAQLASTSAALADRNALYEENLALKSRLGRDASVHSLLASVVLRPPTTPYDTLMIDAGSTQGVALGDYVSAGGTTVIGTVDVLYPTSARVKLLSSSGESYQGLLIESSAHAAVPVTVVGQGGGSFMTEVPAQTAALPGDSIVLPGIMGGYTGRVSRVDARTGDSFETLYLQLPANPQELQYVEVLLH